MAVAALPRAPPHLSGERPDRHEDHTHHRRHAIPAATPSPPPRHPRRHAIPAATPSPPRRHPRRDAIPAATPSPPPRHPRRHAIPAATPSPPPRHPRRDAIPAATPSPPPRSSRLPPRPGHLAAAPQPPTPNPAAPARHVDRVPCPRAVCQVRTPAGAAALDRGDGQALRFGHPPSPVRTGHDPETVKSYLMPIKRASLEAGAPRFCRHDGTSCRQ
jgi:hypothetical protein